MTYIFVNGQFQLESKRQIKDRMGWSPDLGDGIALTFATPDVPKEELLLMRLREHKSGGNKILCDWDPHDDNRK